MINDTNIRPEDIIHHLSELPGMTIEKALALLDALDKQNVPKAVSLIQHLKKIGDLSEPTSPPKHKRHKVINFLAHFLSCFVLPFIDIEMNLSQQLKSLVEFAHIAAALQVKHGSSCLTGALYSDTQAILKNIIFTTARLKLIDPDLEFYIILEGTDRLEMLFGDCRTQDHARNFDIEQLGGKLGVASLINAAFEKNPKLDRGHRRLNLKDALGIDHVNPASWKGDSRVGSVDLKLIWLEGREAASRTLKGIFGENQISEFEVLFSKPNCDLLRPEGKYVGVKETPDDTRSEEENPDLSEDLASLFQTLPPHPDSDVVNADTTHIPIQSNLNSLPSLPLVQSSEILSDDDFSDMLSGLSIEDFLPDTDNNLAGSSISETSNSDPQFSKTIEIEGKSYLKGSLVATLTSDRSKKVTMRTLRVQGVALEDLRPKSKFQDITESPEFDGKPVMKSLDLGAFLVRCGDQICLTVMEVIGFNFSKEKQTRSVALLDDLSNATKEIKVIGQIIEIRQPPDSEEIWEWSGNYISVDTTSKELKITKALYVTEIPSVLIQPVNQRTSHGSERPLTWSFEHSHLANVIEVLWQDLNPDSNEIISNIQLLPEINNKAAVPYKKRDGA